MTAARIVARAAVSALGRGRAALEPGGVSAVQLDPELAALGLRSARAARAPLHHHGALDPARALLTCAAEDLAAELDGRAPGWRARRLCVVLGTSSGGMVSQEAAFDALMRGADLPLELAAQASYFAPLRGLVGVFPSAPVVQVYAACASSAMALGVGLRVLQSGAADLVIAGGYDVIANLVAAGFEALGVVTASEPRPFSLARDGLALGEGAALLALSAESHVRSPHECAAPERVPGAVAPSGSPTRGFAKQALRLLGFAASSDAAHPTAPTEGAPGLVSAARRALSQAGVTCAAPGTAEGRMADAGRPADEGSAAHPGREADYSPGEALGSSLDEGWLISAHGTATLVNDREEALAIAELSARAPVHAFKARVGHTLGAGSALELLAALECLEQGAPELPSPPHEAALRTPRAASGPHNGVLKLAMAFGGCNVALTAARGDRPVATQKRYGARIAQVGEPARGPAWERLGRLARSGPLTARRLDALSALSASAALSLVSTEELEALAVPGAAVRPRVGVVLGTIAATLEHNQGYHQELARRGYGRAPARGFPATSPNLAPGMVSSLFGLGGPAFSVGAGPGAPFEALFVGAQLVEAGDAEEVWVIAADVASGDVPRLLAASGLEVEPGALALRVVRAAADEALDAAAILAQLTHLEEVSSSSRQHARDSARRAGWPRLHEWLQGDRSGCARGPSK